jgi:folate-binding protein YgfZ
MTQPKTLPLNGITPISHLGVIRAVGADAASFLHGQLSNDFALLKFDQARLAAFCTAKGRMLASFIGFRRSADEIVLICDRSLLAPRSSACPCLCCAPSASSAMRRLTSPSTAWPARPPSSLRQGCCGLDAQAARRCPCAGALPRCRQPACAVDRPCGPGPEGQLLSEDLWQWSEVQSGVATLSAPVVDAFVPQMLNYESLGGVNFKKGCYPGQEVVARSQFRGTLKRRAYLVMPSRL